MPARGLKLFYRIYNVSASSISSIILDKSNAVVVMFDIKTVWYSLRSAAPRVWNNSTLTDKTLTAEPPDQTNQPPTWLIWNVWEHPVTQSSLYILCRPSDQQAKFFPNFLPFFMWWEPRLTWGSSRLAGCGYGYLSFVMLSPGLHSYNYCHDHRTDDTANHVV